MQVICSKDASSGFSNVIFAFPDIEVTSKNIAQPAKQRYVLQEQENFYCNRLQCAKQYASSAVGKSIYPLCWPNINNSILKQLSFSAEVQSFQWKYSSSVMSTRRPDTQIISMKLAKNILKLI